MLRPVDDPRDPGYRPPVDSAAAFPPSGEVDHPNLKEVLYEHLTPERTVVDVGCGPGPFEYKKYEARFIAFDMFEPENHDGMVQGRDEFRPGKLDTFPIKDETVDAVVMGFILEHVKSPEVFLQEAERVLKPGGWVYVAIPNYRSLEDRLFRLATKIAGSSRGPHIQRFTLENFQALVRKQTNLEPIAWHRLQASYLWMNHPKLRRFRKPWIRVLESLSRLGIDGFSNANIQMLLRKIEKT